jgi:hypothetical protein
VSDLIERLRAYGGNNRNDYRHQAADAIAAKDREIAELRARIPAQGEYERQEAICVEAAMSQWERSLKRPDMQEKDRVRGAVEAYKRQAFAFTLPIRSLGKEGSGE